MKSVFADNFYFFALINDKDPARPKAEQFTRTFKHRIVTTGWILMELGDGLSHLDNRATFIALLDRLRASPKVHVIPCQEEWFETGIALYRSRLDKQWSLTDCISFEVMRHEGITEALTGDHHFEQAGFVALLK